MNNIGKVRLAPLGKSIFIKPFKMIYEQNGIEKTWDLMEIHDSVAIIIYNVTRDVLVFVKQFRPGVYYSKIKPEDRLKPIDTKVYPADLGMTIELCAGIKDKDKSLVEIAQEEVIEETGYKVPIDKFEKVHWYNASVGISGTVVAMFYCEVTDDMRVTQGGGVDQEMIEVIDMNLEETMNFLKKDIIPSPGSLITGIYWFLMYKHKKNITN